MASNKIAVYVDDDKNTNLHYASVNGDLEKIKEELDHNNEIDPVNYLGWTPLMMATRHGHIDVIQFFIDKRADATRINSFGYNLLLIAVASGKIEVVFMILQHLLCGGISKRSMQNVLSPVSLSVLFDNLKMTEYLIDQGFCVNAVTPETEITPIMFANTMRNIEIINLLRNKGAKEEERSKPVQMQQQTKSQRYVNVPHPLILVNSNQAPFIPVPSNIPIQRHYSNMSTPASIQGISPISPSIILHHVFFPHNFSPSQYPINPSPIYDPSRDIINVRITNNETYSSPCFNPAY